MNYNTTYWRKIRNDTCYSYVLMYHELVVVLENDVRLTQQTFRAM